MGDFDGKFAFLTGAGAGIGRISSIMLAQQGARVVLAELRPESGKAVEAAIKDLGGDATFVQVDVTDDSSVSKAARATIDQYGSIDILVNCAGGSVPQDGLVTELDLLAWDHTINLNLKGTFLPCRHIIPEIVKVGGGSVINFTSWLGIMGGQFRNAYSTTKGGIVSLTKTLAAEFAAQGVRINAIAPGSIRTERSLVKNADNYAENPPPTIVYRRRLAERYPFSVGEPEDIGNVVLFLASNKSRMITGAIIPADGGRSAYL